MLTKKVVIASIFFLLLAFLGLIFRPVPIPSPDNTITTNGTIEEVSMDRGADLIIKLRGDDRLYYIDDGLKDGRLLSTFQGELSGKSVEIHYIKFWTPLDPLGKHKYISKVNLNDTRIYPTVE